MYEFCNGLVVTNLRLRNPTRVVWSVISDRMGLSRALYLGYRIARSLKSHGGRMCA